MQRGATLRSPWLAIGWLTGLLAFLTGLATVLYAAADWQTALFGALLLLLPGGWVVVRVPFMRVRLGSEALTVHGLFRAITTPWESIEHVTLEQIDDKVVGAVYAPVLHRGEMPELVLTQLAGYTTEGRAGSSRMARQAATIAHCLNHR